MEKKNKIKLLGIGVMVFGLGVFLLLGRGPSPSVVSQHASKNSPLALVAKRSDDPFKRGERNLASEKKKAVPLRKIGSLIAKKFLPKKSDPLYKLGKGKAFAHLKKLSAIRKKDYRRSFGEIVEEKGAFVIFIAKEEKEDFLAVVKRSGSPYLGIVTGLIKVNTGDYDRAQELASKHSMELVHFDKSIGWAYFQENDFSKLTENLALLNSQEEGLQAKAEVLEIPKVSK